jgi:hypothetical protein
MKRMLFVALVALCAVALPLRAAAQHSHADSPKATLIVADDLLVGATVLHSGEYRVRCRTIEGKTFLVVTAEETGKEVARVPCTAKNTDGKVAETQFSIGRDKSGKRALTAVRIKGETTEHQVVVN